MLSSSSWYPPELALLMDISFPMPLFLEVRLDPELDDANLLGMKIDLIELSIEVPNLPSAKRGP